jgi:hypothetical protein
VPPAARPLALTGPYPNPPRLGNGSHGNNLAGGYLVDADLVPLTAGLPHIIGRTRRQAVSTPGRRFSTSRNWRERRDSNSRCRLWRPVLRKLIHTPLSAPAAGNHPASDHALRNDSNLRNDLRTDRHDRTRTCMLFTGQMHPQLAAPSAIRQTTRHHDARGLSVEFFCAGSNIPPASPCLRRLNQDGQVCGRNAIARKTAT